MFCYFDKLRPILYILDILHWIFPCSILRPSIFCHLEVLSINILPFVFYLSIFFLLDILLSIYCPFDNFDPYFATSIFCLRYLTFDILHSICCLSIFCGVYILPFDIKRSDILHFRYFATRYSAASILRDFDILQPRYFAFKILCSIFCDSTLSFSIFYPKPSLYRDIMENAWCWWVFHDFPDILLDITLSMLHQKGRARYARAQLQKVTLPPPQL